MAFIIYDLWNTVDVMPWECECMTVQEYDPFLVSMFTPDGDHCYVVY